MSPLWRRRAVVVVVILAGGAFLRTTLLRKEPVPVTVFRVAPGRVEESVTNSKAGTVKTRRRAALSPEIGGRVELLPVRKGDRVRKGQLLVRLANADYQAQVRGAQRSIEASHAGEREACQRAVQAERDLARMIALARESLVSQDLKEQAQTQRDTAVAGCEAARSRVQQGQASLDFARVTRGKTELRAPFDGVVADLRGEVGEWITPSPPGVPIPALLELLDPDAIYVSAPLDEVDVGKVRVGQVVRVTIDAFPGRAIPGHLTRVAPYVVDVQQQSRTFEVEVDLDDAAFARTLLPGSSADVEVILDARDGVLRVPSYALIDGKKALVVRDGTLVAVPVEVGLKNWGFAEVKRGLSAGELVVVSLDRADVKEGARARVAEEAAK
jgi:HlyD family secretion protein